MSEVLASLVSLSSEAGRRFKSSTPPSSLIDRRPLERGARCAVIARCSQRTARHDHATPSRAPRIASGGIQSGTARQAYIEHGRTRRLQHWPRQPRGMTRSRAADDIASAIAPLSAVTRGELTEISPGGSDLVTSSSPPAVRKLSRLPQAGGSPPAAANLEGPLHPAELMHGNTSDASVSGSTSASVPTGARLRNEPLSPVTPTAAGRLVRSWRALAPQNSKRDARRELRTSPLHLRTSWRRRAPFRPRRVRAPHPRDL